MSEPSSLVIAGVSQAGVGLLFDHLARHPAVCPERFRGFESLAPLRSGRAGVDPRTTFGIQFESREGASYQLEAAPSYFAGGAAMAAAVRDRLPTPRVVVSLRDPVDRLLCAHRAAVARGRGPKTLAAFVERVANVSEGRSGRRDVDGDMGELVGSSRYADHLPAWVDAFGGRLRVLVYELWSQELTRHLADLHAWLELSPTPPAMQADASMGEAGADDWYRPVRHPASTPRVRRRAARGRRNGSLSRLLRTGGESTAPLEELRAAPQAATLRALFVDSNRRLVRQLRDLGLEQLPPWLASDGPGPAISRAS